MSDVPINAHESSQPPAWAQELLLLHRISALETQTRTDPIVVDAEDPDPHVVARTPDLHFLPLSRIQGPSSRALTTTTPSELHHSQPGSIHWLGAQSMTMAVFSSRLKTRHLLTTKIKSLKQFKTWSSPIVIPTEAKEELFSWLDHPHS